ncbi:TIGR00730 family Rossman fold protein, partial [Candidatus Uhrbacteria bacterium]|nr:TIGR00730 family Rossman fold protein [Candidatus Uhrbacteria bacterium]
VFGSARLHPGTRWYKECVYFGKIAGKAGFNIITGGGPGIMEAANKGAVEAGVESIGINIQLPFEQRINKYVRKGMAFDYFFTRKVMLAASAQAYIFFPGGFGTVDEFSEMLTLVQTKKMAPVPMVCVGKEFWDPWMAWCKKMLEMKTISPSDMQLFHVVDTAEEALALIKHSEEREIF